MDGNGKVRYYYDNEKKTLTTQPNENTEPISPDNEDLIKFGLLERYNNGEEEEER